MRLSDAKKEFKAVRKILRNVDRQGFTTDAARSAARLWLRKYFRKKGA